MNFKTIFFIGLITLTHAWASDPYYLIDQSIDGSLILPPIDDSLDLQDLILLQQTRSQIECDRAAQEEMADAVIAYAQPLGPLTVEQASKLNEMYERLFDEVNFFTKDLKQFFKRPRPFVTYASITPCIRRPPSYSFPSGHAAGGLMTALAFSHLYPEHADAIIRRGLELGSDRALGGVHYPSDVEAGRSVAKLVWDKLKVHPQFIEDLRQLRTNSR